MAPPDLGIERVVDDLVAAEPLGGVHPGDLQRAPLARVHVDVVSRRVATHLGSVTNQRPAIINPDQSQLTWYPPSLVTVTRDMLSLLLSSWVELSTNPSRSFR